MLREAGVVDAGGAGLLEIVRGVAAALAGEPLPEAPPAEAHEAGLEAVHQELSEYRYCTVFLVEGEGLDAEALETELEQFGDSLLVVGDPSALKIHVHTDDPGRALALGTAPRHDRRRSRSRTCTSRRRSASERLLAAVPDPELTLETGVVAVVPGSGNRRLFESYGAARVIEGGQTMNPSTADILAAIEATPATEVLVLPNNSNVILSAEQAAQLTDKPVRVLPSRSVPAGLAAIVRYLPVARRRRERGRDARGDRAGRDGRGDASPRATWSSTGSTCARAPGSVSRTASPSRARTTSTRSRPRSPGGCSTAGARC